MPHILLHGTELRKHYTGLWRIHKARVGCGCVPEWATDKLIVWRWGFLAHSPPFRNTPWSS